MEVPTPEEAVRVLEDGHEAVLALVERLSEETFERPATIGGGDWSAKDLLGHLTFWKQNALSSLADWRAGREWELGPMLAAGEEDELNARSIEAKAVLSALDIRTEYENVHAELIFALGAMTADEWGRSIDDTTWGAKLGSILGGPDGYFGHTSAHLGDLEAYVGA